MANPILDMLQSNNSSASQNGLPTSMSDPKMRDAINYVNNHGGNPKQAFYALCKEKMLNPATIINNLMGR